MLTKIIKRNGDTTDFDIKRIITAIKKSEENVGIFIDDNFSIDIAKVIFNSLEKKYSDTLLIPTVEDVQDSVEKHLVESGNFEIAKSYILYRSERATKRAEKRINELKKIDKHLLKVTKKSGKKELFSEEKLKKFFSIISKGFEKKCKFEDIYKIIKLRIVDGINTKDIIPIIIKSSVDCISIDNIYWQNIAGRTYVISLYKEAIKNRNLDKDNIYDQESVLEHFKNYVNKKYYYSDFFKYYSEEDIKEVANVINKERDFDYGYSTMIAFVNRYLLNINKKIHELPQEMYLAVALFLAIPEKKSERLKIAKKIYEVCSSQKLSLPTPTLLNARTNHHQLSSCFKLNIDDDLRDIYHQIENMAQISKFGGGIGVYCGNIRSKGASIRYMEKASGGVIPWIRVMNDTATAVNQLGSRNGAISPTLDIWHRDINDFLNLQTETGDIRSKAFDIFPAISIPDIFMERVENDEEWTLFDPFEIKNITNKNLQDFFCEDFSKFYKECENNKKIKLKTKIKAKDLLKTALKTVVETGMPYFFYRDTVNRVNPNKHVGNIYSTQLCTEICQNTSPSEFMEESLSNGEINLKYRSGDTVVCNLASINIAKVNTKKDIEEVFPIAMKVLDNVISLNFYPIKEAKYTSERYRSVGLGFMGLAEYLACSSLSYDKEEARIKVDELFEDYAFATLNESNKLSKERGEYPLFKGSEWSKGNIFGRNEDWYLNNTKDKKRWIDLIKKIKKEGLRFAYHLSPAPNTSTAGIVGTTAGLLPIYKKMFIETNAIAPTVNIAPNLNKENFWYYKEYKTLNMNDVIDMFSVIYKWIDQSASFEWMINPQSTSPAELYNYYIKAWKNNIKTVYYVRSMSGEIDNCESCSG
jgi:ribonucleoside-diphosphate reductase alpha chain